MTEISIIVPVYNVEEYIYESALSIFNQSFDSYEVIFVNDGSKDDSIINLEKAIKESGFKNYKIIVKDNQGLPAARNTGFLNSEGRYVCFIDSDDIISSEYLKKLHSAIIENDLDICFCLFEETDITNRHGNSVKQCDTEVIDNHKLQRKILERSVKIHCCAVLFSREVIKEYKFNEKLKFGEDIEFIWRVFTNKFKVGKITGKFYKYLIRKNSIMSTQTFEKIEIFIDEFTNTINSLKLEGKIDFEISPYIIPRVKFALIHSNCRVCSYNLFK
ncbi:MAG: glycosyltransferase family 2 protein, partial [Bacilli bacterium]